jgi:hypothetical protein
MLGGGAGDSVWAAHMRGENGHLVLSSPYDFPPCPGTHATRPAYSTATLIVKSSSISVNCPAALYHLI